jgi:hypothetical protein
MKTWDAIVGVLVMMGSCATMCLAGAGGLLAGVYASLLGSEIAKNPTAREQLPNIVPAVPMIVVALIFLVAIIFPLFKFFVGFGLIRQKRWAFVVLLVFAIIEFASAFGSGLVLLSLNVIFGIYALLRLTGSAGPKP